MTTAPMLAGCSGGGETGNSSSSAGGGGTSQQTQSQPDNASGNQSAGELAAGAPVQLPSPQAVSTIPTAFRGRWAAVADDCTAGGPGLLVVEAAGLSVDGAHLAGPLATVGSDTLTVGAAPPDAGGRTRSERLTLIDGGQTLVRQQQAPAQASNYRRCPA